MIKRNLSTRLKEHTREARNGHSDSGHSKHLAKTRYTFVSHIDIHKAVNKTERASNSLNCYITTKIQFGHRPYKEWVSFLKH